MLWDIYFILGERTADQPADIYFFLGEGTADQSADINIFSGEGTADQPAEWCKVQFFQQSSTWDQSQVKYFFL